MGEGRRIADDMRRTIGGANHTAYDATIGIGDECGNRLGECARRLRLQWAAQELAVDDRPLVEVAVEAGFCDQSHFTRAFGRQYGVTPARFRAMHR